MTNKKLGKFKEKVQVYEHYLDIYLSILTRVSPNIHIYEPLAGDGKDGYFEGSIKAAIEIINKHQKDDSYSIKYFINDKDIDKCNKLRKECKAHNWIDISNLDAKDFIDKYTNSTVGYFNLWFIDPYGYTQVEKEDIEKIINFQKSSDLIIFFPTQFVSRFISKLSKEKTPVRIMKFCEQWGIKYEEIKKIKDPEMFEKVLKDAMKLNYPKCYISSYTLKQDNKKNIYTLFFISKHYLALEKFLETKGKVLESQSPLFLDVMNVWQQYEQKAKESLKKYLQTEKTNNELYIWGIKNELLPKSVKKLLQDLEDEKTIIIKPSEQQKKRRGKAFYIANKYYNEKDVRLIYNIADSDDISNTEQDLFSSAPYPKK